MNNSLKRTNYLFFLFFILSDFEKLSKLMYAWYTCSFNFFQCYFLLILFCVVFFFLAHRPGSQPPPPVPGQPLLSNGNAYTYHNAYQPQPAGYYAAYPPPPPAGYPGYPPPGSVCLHLMLHEHKN